MILGSDWMVMYHQLNKNDRISLKIDGAPLQAHLHCDGDIIRLSMPLGVQKIPKDKTRVLFEEETGRAWLAYKKAGEVVLHYEGAFDPFSFGAFQKRLRWFLRVSIWVKQCQLEEEVSLF